MEQQKIIRGSDEAIWAEIKNDLRNITYPFVYSAQIEGSVTPVFLNIEIDLGGGFESGYQATSLTVPVPLQFTSLTSRIQDDRKFRFALHNEDFIDKVGKFFGMEDVVTGYPEFDKKLVVKTNDSEKVKHVFADAATRETFQTMDDFNLSIQHYDHDDRHSSLELSIDREITDIDELKKIYSAFIHVYEMFQSELHVASYGA